MNDIWLDGEKDVVNTSEFKKFTTKKIMVKMDILLIDDFINNALNDILRFVKYNFLWYINTYWKHTKFDIF